MPTKTFFGGAGGPFTERGAQLPGLPLAPRLSALGCCEFSAAAARPSSNHSRPLVQVPFFGMNLSVGLSVSLQGFGLQVAKGEAAWMHSVRWGRAVRPWPGASKGAIEVGAGNSNWAGMAAAVLQCTQVSSAFDLVSHQACFVAGRVPLQACLGSCRLEPSAWWEQRGEPAHALLLAYPITSMPRPCPTVSTECKMHHT